MQQKDSWKSELKEFSSKNGYDLNRNGDSAPLLLDVLEGFLKYEVGYLLVIVFSVSLLKPYVVQCWACWPIHLPTFVKAHQEKMFAPGYILAFEVYYFPILILTSI